MFWTLAALSSIAVGVLVWGEWKTSAVRFVAKPIASLGFLAAALERGAFDSTYGKTLLLGLVLAALGDVFLLGSSRPTFLAGLVSFLLGHLVYVVAFVGLGIDPMWSSAAAIATGVIAVVVVRWLVPFLAADMRGPVFAYILVISLMVVAAAGSTADGATAWILIGAIGFFLSDLAVARNQFVVESITNRAWGLPLYYASQFILAWTIGV
ncbi:MAG: lysoplasmalogenase [Acidimicrobiia bacterium]|nr:lysoplasmalogenase [Acidimicrobiia bacterium]